MAHPEHLKILNQGVKTFNEWRKDNFGTDPNLIKANLSGANLKDTNLSRVNLSGAKLKDTDLRGANLGGAELKDTDLIAAKVKDTELQRSEPQEGEPQQPGSKPYGPQ